MPIRKAHLLPKAGDTFSRKFNNSPHKMTVVDVGKKIGYKVGNAIYKTPSAAAKSITQHAVNGWAFWYMEK